MMLIESISTFAALLCHLVIFFGSFYVAMHNRVINDAVITLLWYVGLASFFNVALIVLGYFFGDVEDFPLTYDNLGHISEAIFAGVVATTIGTLFFLTVKTDYQARKARKKGKGRRTR